MIQTQNQKLMAELLKFYASKPNLKFLKKAAETLEQGGLIIYPTDTVYALGCDVLNKGAVEKVAKIKGVKVEKADFSFVFHNLSHISDYTKQFDTSIFKLLNKALPGPFTFILPANKSIPKLFHNKKKTIGIRVPDNGITRSIVSEYGNPLISTSIHDEDEVIEYTADPELIHEKYEDQVDIVIDGGYGNNEASTVVDLSDGNITILRQGLGILEHYL